MQIKRFAIITALVALVALPTFADTYSIDKAHSDAAFTIRHLISRVNGKFSDFAGTINIDEKNPAASNVEFTIKTASIDTGNEGRDKHLRSDDFFAADKNPEITFKSTAIKPSAKKNVYDVTGDFTMKGVTKKVTIPVTYLGSAKDPWGNMRAGFTLNTTINRQDYGITWNKALDAGGTLLSDDVEVTVNVEAVKKQEPKAAAAPSK